MTPVLKLPVITLEGRSVGTEVRLANGDILVAVLTGVDLKKARPIPGAIFYRGEDKFLFRPSAPMVSGPDHLARFLGLAAKDVFPIIFDISKIAVGDPNAVKGEIPLDAPPSQRGKEYFKQLLKEKNLLPERRK